MTPTPAFTENVDLAGLASRFHSEDKCRAYLEQLRWPEGVRCPRCDASKGVSRIETRGQFDCDSCGYQFSVRAGTIFHDSHLPLWKWFLAVYVMTEGKQGVSANQLKRMLGVSYKTAWYLGHRIRAAMKDEAPDVLRGIVEGDATYAGRSRIEGRIRAGDEPLETSTRAGDHMNALESVRSLFERSVAGSYHHLSAKHLSAYLDETAFRYNNRENNYLFRDTLVRLIGADSMPYTELITRT